MPVRNLLYTISHWETWDWRIKYVPLIPAWLWYCIRSGSFWFFTPSNPSLVFGGFDGVSKRDMYAQLPAHLYPKSVFISQGLSFKEVEGLYALSGLRYPVAVKPEVGRMGLMFRKIESRDDLKLYHEKMPVNYIIQDFIHYPVEVSVFYYRFPSEKRGAITGFLKKESLEVTGDGKSTLLELMSNSPRALFKIDEMKLKHKDKLDTVIPNGRVIPLSYALNLSRGGKQVSLEHENDEKLLAVFDGLSHHSKHFYYGRFDLKCASIEDLKLGRNFCIMEYNGSGGEPDHVYGNDYTLVQACSILRQHWGLMYRISRSNYSRGVKYWDLRQGWRFFKEANKHVRMLKRLDLEFPALTSGTYQKKARPII